jgi:hypothetical protein
MHQTKYFELSVFFSYSSIFFSPSLADIIESVLYVYTGTGDQEITGDYWTVRAEMVQEVTRPPSV